MFKMKIKSFLFLAFMFFGSVIFGQTNSEKRKPTPPSDAPSGYTYDFDKTIKLIMDRMTNPNEFNKDVQPLVSANDFPEYKTGELLNSEMRNKIRIWMENNPTLIINTLKQRNDIVTPF